MARLFQKAIVTGCMQEYDEIRRGYFVRCNTAIIEAAFNELGPDMQAMAERMPLHKYEGSTDFQLVEAK